jgi:hypothetical protein
MDLQSRGWYGALTLRERVSCLRADPNPAAYRSSSDSAVLRGNHWKSQPPFEQDDYFAQRLAVAGISEEEFLCALSKPSDLVQVDVPPAAWLLDLAEAYAEDNQRRVDITQYRNLQKNAFTISSAWLSLSLTTQSAGYPRR